MPERLRLNSVPATRALLALYRTPASAPALAEGDWPAVLGATRRSRTLGHLGLVLRQAGVLDALEPRVRAHFDSIAVLIAQRRRQLRLELSELDRATAAVDTPILLLKGSAYEAQALPLAGGRLPADVDLLVERSALTAMERALRAGGWRPAEINDYDERYYREWSHELPPFRHPSRGVECDLHHAITPAMRGPGIDTRRLIADSLMVAHDGPRRLRVLQPVDQLLHCALHTFKDSDLDTRLREAMDFDLLYRHHAATDPELAQKLAERARMFGQARPLWWAMHFARRWLGTPIPSEAMIRLPAPAAASIRSMEWLCDRAMLPGRRHARQGLDRVATTVLLARYHVQRLPLSRLLPHLLEKSRRRLFPAGAATEAQR